jgi:hypothetical protein
MTLVLISAAAAVAIAAAWHYAFGISRYVRRRVVIHTIDEQSLRGRLVSVTVDGITLEEAELLAGSEVAVIQGRTFVPRANVSWVQRLEGGAE